MDKKQHERHTEILKNLLKRQDNKICCDCKKKDPRWASWNLGCFMCIRCSGIHRSLGVHISKVKSADLDNWKPNEIENVVKWGNAKANYYWESLLPTASSVSDANIEQFIRAKYERKQYVMSGPIPDPDTLILSSDCTTAVCLFNFSLLVLSRCSSRCSSKLNRYYNLPFNFNNLFNTSLLFNLKSKKLLPMIYSMLFNLHQFSK